MKGQIESVNLAANSLVESGHPRSKEVQRYQDHLNARSGVDRAWAGGISSQHLMYPLWLCTATFVPPVPLSFPATVSYLDLGLCSKEENLW